MRLRIIGFLLCGLLSLAASQERSNNDEEVAILRADQQAKHIQRKQASDTERRRRKYKRPSASSSHTSSNSSATFTSHKKDEDTEYNQRVRTFASAIKDTDTFLRFLKQEESKHLGNYIRSRGFNFNNRTLTTRFLQTAPPITNEISNAVYELLPKELKYADKTPTTTPKPTVQSYSIFYKPSAILSAPSFSEKPELRLRAQQSAKKISATTQPSVRFVDGDDEILRVPNRGLVPPLPSQDENEVRVTYATSSPLRVLVTSAQGNATEASNERRASLPVKKQSRRAKNRMPDRYLKQADDEYDEIQLSVAETAYYKKGTFPSRVRMAKEYDAQQVIPGIAGKDYTVFSQPPSGSQFTCAKGNHGYYADVNAGCQVFYICTGDGRGEPMLCPNGTLFNQQVLVCDWWFNVVCN